MIAPEERQPDATVPGHLAAIGACRSLTVTSVSEIGWWRTERFLDDIKAGGGPAACQWGMHFDSDNAAASCTLLEVEDRLGKVTRILLDAGWNPDYMSERLRATGVDRLLKEGGIDFLFLTHEHLDHFWGIEAVLTLAPEITILVPGTISANGLAWLGGRAFPAAGIENRVPHRGKVVRMLPGGVHRLADGIVSATFDVPIWLGIRGEQSIYVNLEDRGLVCVTGCCHQGVIDLVDYAVDNLGAGDHLFGLYGGLHIAPVAALTDKQRETVHALGRYGFKKIAANHCTGAQAIALMHELGYPILGGSGQNGSTGTDHVGNGDVVQV
jgi:7,8-dihydropterin-6-yl-methyl-4-(beta-D-ribofuranosyl)aminobenzene 5'-phosphate synthase